MCVLSLDPPSSFRCVDEETTSVDGSGYLMFFKQISQLYQGLGPIDPPPYYEPRAIKFPELLKAPLPLHNRFDPFGPAPWEQPDKKAMDFVAFRFTATQLTEIRSSVTKRTKSPGVTRMDIVMGLLAQCLSEVEPESKPIDTVSYVVNVSAFVACPVPRLIGSTASRNGHIPSQRST